MTAADLLRDLLSRGVELRAEGDRLRWRAPPGVVTQEVLEILAERKAEILTLLSEPRPAPYLDARGELVVPMDADPSACWWLGGKSVLETLDDLDAGPESRARYEHLH